MRQRNGLGIDAAQIANLLPLPGFGERARPGRGGWRLANHVRGSQGFTIQ